jgi:uncharacterized protein (TIGR02145 family)
MAKTNKAATKFSIKKQRNFIKFAGMAGVMAGLIGVMVFCRPDQISQAAIGIAPSVGPTTGGVTVYIAGDFQPSPTMQSFTHAECLALPIYDRNNPNSAASILSTVTRRDERNNQFYTIRRLQDGKCWMIDNLKLELGVVNADPAKDTTVLEPANTSVMYDTAVDFNWSKLDPIFAGHGGNFLDYGNNTQDGTNSTASPNLDAWRQNDPNYLNYCRGNSPDSLTGSGVTLDAMGAKSGCGYLYNFFTTTAGSAAQANFNITYVDFDNAPASICPAGWRLPTAAIRDSQAPLGWTIDTADAAVLNASMNANTPVTSGVIDNYYQGWYPNGSFRGIASGSWDEYGLANQGWSGNYWSSGVVTADGARNYGIRSNQVSAAGNQTERYYGQAVRCVALDVYTPAAPSPPPPPVVKFGGVPATNVTLSEEGDLITLTTPPHAAGLVDVTIDNGFDPIQTVTYTYTEPMTITGVSPNHSVTVGGDEVTISGTNIPQNPTVTFGSGADAVEAVVVSVSLDGTSVTVTTPPHAVGTVNVAVANSTNRITLHNVFTYSAPYLNLTTEHSTENLGSVAPTDAGAFTSGVNVVRVNTNYPAGYLLSVSTNQPSSNPNAKDMKHASLNYRVVAATANVCTWNDAGKVLSETENQLENNAWGFSVGTGLISQKLCQVPDLDHPLKIKSTDSSSTSFGDETMVGYGVKVDNRLAAGGYRATVVYSAVGNV